MTLNIDKLRKMSAIAEDIGIYSGEIEDAHMNYDDATDADDRESERSNAITATDALLECADALRKIRETIT